MKVYLIRHGEAVSSESDPERPLSKKGCADIKKVASFIKPQKITVDHIWHSGKLRASQTAEILADVVTVKDCSAHKGLKPNDNVTAIANELEAYDTNLMLVGHLPFMANLASLLVSGKEFTSVVSFDAGSIACLKRSDPGQWHIEWMLTPKILL